MLLSEKMKEIFGQSKNRVISLEYCTDEFKKVVASGLKGLTGRDYIQFNTYFESNTGEFMVLSIRNIEPIVSESGCCIISGEPDVDAGLVIEYIFGEGSFARYAKDKDVVTITMDYSSFLQKMLDI